MSFVPLSRVLCNKVNKDTSHDTDEKKKKLSRSNRKRKHVFCFSEIRLIEQLCALNFTYHFSIDHLLNPQSTVDIHFRSHSKTL